MIDTGRPGPEALFMLGIGIALGVALWALSPWLTGRAEPWDAERPIWGLSWVPVALVGGLFGRLRGVCLPLGYALGQMLVTARPLLHADFGMLALAWMFIAGYATVAMAATLVIAAAVAVLARPRRRRRSASARGSGPGERS